MVTCEGGDLDILSWETTQLHYFHLSHHFSKPIENLRRIQFFFLIDDNFGFPKGEKLIIFIDNDRTHKCDSAGLT